MHITFVLGSEGEFKKNFYFLTKTLILYTITLT